LKVNILWGDRDGALTGYLNVDPLAGPDWALSIRGDVMDLSPFVGPAEASEVVAHDVLDCLDAGDVDAALAHWASRLRHGACLHLSTLNFREVARLEAQGRLGRDELNRLIYGKRRSTNWPPDVMRRLTALGLDVVRASYENHRGVVTCRRP